jgi:hypothetical protein
MSLIVPIEHGSLIEIQQQNPGAGNNFTMSLAGNFRWELISMKFRLVTDANAADRHPDLDIVTVGTNTIIIHTEKIITASITTDIAWLAGFPIHTAAEVTRMTLGFPQSLPLNGGGSISSVITQIQAGDNLTGIIGYFRRWPMQTI